MNSIKNIGRGRIFRVDHESTHRGPQPRMLEESPLELVKHLAHENGWWRSEAQKLIILHGDKVVVPELKRLALSGEKALTRLHAFWTLEGLSAVTPDLLVKGMQDKDAQVRGAAIRIAEPLLINDSRFDPILVKLATDPSPAVVIQAMLSINHGRHPQAEKFTEGFLARNQNNPHLAAIATKYRANLFAMEAERKKLEELQKRNKALAESVIRGKVTYSTLCKTCHGENGKGHPASKGSDLHLAPSLAGSPRVIGHKSRLSRILLHGLIGPIDGKTYADGLMMPLAANSDEWIADVANYARNSWGNQGSIIQPSDIKRVREESASRIGPWKLDELDYYDPPTLQNQDKWILTASSNSDKLKLAIDGKASTRWDSGAFQKNGMWLTIELPEPVKPMTLVLDTKKSNQDYPRGYTVEVSKDGQSWTEPVAQGHGDGAITSIELDSPGLAKFIRVNQTGVSKNKYWSIHEMSLNGTSKDARPPVSMAETLAGMNAQDLAQQAIQQGDALRGAALFYDKSNSCAKCHDPKTGPRLGPDLAVKRKGVTAQTLVEAVLDPSKEIHEDFKQISVLTADGVVLKGFRVSENDKVLIIREPAGGQEIKIPQDDIDDVATMKVSAMPVGLVNQLSDQSQFSDLIKFLSEIQEGGSEAMKRLKSKTQN